MIGFSVPAVYCVPVYLIRTNFAELNFREIEDLRKTVKTRNLKL